MALERLEFLEADNICDDNISFMPDGDKLGVSIENPWAGDTENGFGYSTYFEMTKEQVMELIKFLSEWAGA